MVPDHSSRSASVVVAERSDRSLRACSSSTSVMSLQQSIRTLPAVLSSNNSSVLPPAVVYNFSNCTVHHVGSMPSSSSSSSDVV